MPESLTENTKKASKLRRFVNIKLLPKLIFVLALIGFAAWSFYNYRQSQKEVMRLSTIEGQQELQQKEIESLLEKVKAHMMLPEDEEPTVATISDVDALVEQQPFFNGAQNGDKVLVYVKARKAIIYSPERDVIVNVGAVIVDNSPVAIDETDEEFGLLNIELRNGTHTPGLTRQISARLKEENSAFDFAELTDASNKDYSKTVVVDLGKTDNKDLLTSLGSVLGVSTIIQQLPEGEQESQAEVLVIVGQDQVEPQGQEKPSEE